MSKQIYGAIEFSEKEVRLIIGEFFNTRFNIMRVECEPCAALNDLVIVKKEKLKEAIQKVITRAGKYLGSKVERLILLLPSVNFKRYPLKVKTATASGIVQKKDAAVALEKALKTVVEPNILIANAVPIKYICNGIAYRHVPLKEIAQELIIDIDLLCVDKQIAFTYVGLLEECGIEVLDISLDSYAICKEAALFERTVNQNLILIKADYATTTLALIAKGKLVNADILSFGLDSLLKAVNERYRLPFNVIDRLVKYDSRLNPTSADKSPIFAWNSNDNKAQTLSSYDLSLLVKKSLDLYVAKLNEACKLILAAGDCGIALVGEGAEMGALAQALAQTTGVAVKAYFPETIGARQAKYTALLGAVYAYRDALDAAAALNSSIDLLQFNDAIKKKAADEESITFTTKIRNLFDLKKREDL